MNVYEVHVYHQNPCVIKKEHMTTSPVRTFSVFRVISLRGKTK